MTSRALIIAIEKYPTAQAIVRELPGTLQAGINFRKWLEAKWSAEGIAKADTQILFCSEPVQPGGVGASRNDIINGLLALKDQGQNQTNELFVFFSGHGFSFVERPGARADVIIASDYQSADLSGHCCLNMDQIIGWLRDYLGPGCHYYFLDACRNRLNGTMVSVGTLPPGASAPNAGDPTTFVLQSTTDGELASVGGPFPEALIEGLNGKGKAKVWSQEANDAMYVKFDSLRLFIRSRMAAQPISHSVKGEKGEGEVVLRTIRPVPLVRITVNIKGQLDNTEGTITLVRGRFGVPKSYLFSSWPAEIELEPDAYTVHAIIPDMEVEPANGIKVEAYDDSAITFSVSGGTSLFYFGGIHYQHLSGLPSFETVEEDGSGGAPASQFEIFVPLRDEGGLDPAEAPRPWRRGHVEFAPHDGADGLRALELEESPTATAMVHIVVPSNCFVRIRNVTTGATDEVYLTSDRQLAVGRYSVALRRSGGNTLLKKRYVEFELSKDNLVDLTHWTESLPHASIASRFPMHGDLPDFSESLGGPMVDSDINVWLAILGAGRILDGLPYADFQKIGALPLADFRDAKPNGCAMYVLGAFEQDATTLDIRVDHADTSTDLVRAIEPKDMPGIREARMSVEPGHNFVTFQVDGLSTYTVASFGLRNRAMLITLTLDHGEYCISQYLLPIGSLFEYLQAAMERHLINYATAFDRNHLADVMFLAEASRAFRQRKDLKREFQDDRLRDLLATKWLDPIGTTMVCYELLRRGMRDDIANTAVPNLLRHYRELPDTQCIADMVAAPGANWAGVPLFQDGLRAYPSFYEQLPYPRSHLDFNSMWTAWRDLSYTRIAPAP